MYDYACVTVLTMRPTCHSLLSWLIISSFAIIDTHRFLLDQELELYKGNLR